MKKISIKMLGLAAVITVATSCGKIGDFGNLNSNPNGTTQPITSALLTNTEANLGVFASTINGLRGSLYCQYVAEAQYTDVSLYNEPQLDYGTYAGIMNDCQVIINKNTDPLYAPGASTYGSNANQIAVAKILRSYLIWTITDRWGDVPYSAALQGASNTTPAYDKQEDIYKAMFKDLKDAVAGFNSGAPVQGDIIYGGDQTKWKKLANSLRMMMAVRLSKRAATATYVATEFAAAANDGAGYIATNADNFKLVYPGGSYQNSWYAAYDGGRQDYAYCQTYNDILSGIGSGGLRGTFGGANNPMPYGLLRIHASVIPFCPVLTAAQRDQASPLVVINAASVLLARAEGIERGWLSGQTTTDAQNLYNAAIGQFAAQWGGSDYSSNSAVLYASGAGVSTIGANTYGSIVGSNAVTTTKLQRIALQRYVTAFPNGLQGWAEWRRTGVPDLRPTTYATNSSKQIPRRFVYGSSEYALNPTNLAAAIAGMTGGDKQDSRVWWDQ